MTADNMRPESAALAPAPALYDPRQAIGPFCEKSLSEETRRIYRRVTAEFFRFARGLHPTEVTFRQVLAWRDKLAGEGKSPATVVLKLSVVRSLFAYLIDGQFYYGPNPASVRLVPPPRLSDDPKGRALEPKEVRALLAVPDRSKPEGARDYAMLLVMVRMSLRAAEVCALRTRSSLKWSHGRWVLRCRVKGGTEESWPLPGDIKEAIDAYLKLDRTRRTLLHSDGAEEVLFQPHTNYRTLDFSKPLSTRMVHKMVSRYADYAGLGDVSPHDLRHTAVTRALKMGRSYREIQLMTRHRSVQNIRRYDHDRENMEMNAVNTLSYDED